MQQRTPKILIIEDEESLLKLWQEKFRQEGVNVLSATNGRAALEIAFKNHPDLVIIDLVMPSSEGLTVIKKLREDKWGNRVPIMFLNSWRDPENFSGASGQEDYMPNNWSPEQVVQKVERKLEIMKLAVSR